MVNVLVSAERGEIEVPKRPFSFVYLLEELSEALR
jgi:hypothetical protein